MSALLKAVRKAADLKERLDTLGAERRLTREAYRKQALRNAQIPEPELPLVMTYEQHPQYTSVIQPAMLRMSKIPRDWPGAPPKRLGGWSSAELESALASLGSNVHECFYASIGLAPDDAFGAIAEPDAHQSKLRDLKAKLEIELARVAAAVQLTDVELRPVSDSERAAGLCRLEFTRWPGVFVARDMADHLVDAELRQRRTRAAA